MARSSTIAPNAQPTTPSSLPTTTPPSLLVVIIDIHPLSWSLLANGLGGSALSLPDLLQTVLVFLNAHLASRWGNDVVVYAAIRGRSQLLFPIRDLYEGADEMVPPPNIYAPFHRMNTQVEQGLKRMISEEDELLAEDAAKLNESPSIVSALTKALCHINKLHPPQTPLSSISTHQNAQTGQHHDPDAPRGDGDEAVSRVLIIHASPSAAGAGAGAGYVGLMNCVFAAQKSKIPIDVLNLPTTDSIFLQQAAHLTGGIYWTCPEDQRPGLLQFLHAIYLMPPALRLQPFQTPPQDKVDFRAVCFCHQTVLDVGFVCSVCLSIWCSPIPVCKTCNTKFPLKSLPQLAAAAGIQIKPPNRAKAPQATA